MRCRARRSGWAVHPRAARAPRHYWSWMADRGSMTARLKASCSQFSVTLLRTAQARGSADACRVLGLPPRTRLLERDVLLCCDGVPVVFGHTVTAAATVRRQWPFFRRLGQVPLGSRLFTDPQVVRGSITHAGLRQESALYQRVSAHMQDQFCPQQLLARRALFTRRGSHMLVTDVFLPAIADVMAREDSTR